MTRSLSVAIVGAPYPNKDGSNRAFETKLCSLGEQLELRPEPRNPHDEHAIGVWSARGVQIGYVSSERAVLVGSWLRTGEGVVALFQDEAPWGSVARVGVGGTPDLPKPNALREVANTSAEGVDIDPGFWPDEVPPDD